MLILLELTELEGKRTCFSITKIIDTASWMFYTVKYIRFDTWLGEEYKYMGVKLRHTRPSTNFSNTVGIGNAIEKTFSSDIYVNGQNKHSTKHALPLKQTDAHANRNPTIRDIKV